MLNVQFHDELCIIFVSNPSIVMCLQVESPAHYRRTPSWSDRSYGCDNINRDIFYFGGECGHEKCAHNTLNSLNIDKFTWKEIISSTDTSTPMRKFSPGLLSFESQLLAVGGVGWSLPKDPSPSATYEKHGDFIYTNEHHIYDTEGG